MRSEMNSPYQTHWESVQNAINTCSICLNDCALIQVTPLPTRPSSPITSRRLLFISEAPPESGGFWQIKSHDNLRRNLLHLLGLAGLELPNQEDGQESLQSFLDANFLLLQAIKWPLKKKSFNKLGPAEKRGVISHSVEAHLRHEVALVSPSGILAMGNAAWSACRSLSGADNTLPDAGVETVRSKDYEMKLQQTLVPLNVTFLPVDQNMNRSEQRGHILEDIAGFLNRHGWYRRQSAT